MATVFARVKENTYGGEMTGGGGASDGLSVYTAASESSTDD